ncbi:hypothetical protein DFH09DRAFT_210393 [Mycena vulgaris]|nr:hypothetical protein DFH09DRAFT_210393 [Mycena vulgaris]
MMIYSEAEASIFPNLINPDIEELCSPRAAGSVAFPRLYATGVSVEGRCRQAGGMELLATSREMKDKGNAYQEDRSHPPPSQTCHFTMTRYARPFLRRRRDDVFEGMERSGIHLWQRELEEGSVQRSSIPHVSRIMASKLGPIQLRVQVVSEQRERKTGGERTLHALVLLKLFAGRQGDLQASSSSAPDIEITALGETTLPDSNTATNSGLTLGA